MVYNKPEITKASSLIEAIQSAGEKAQVFLIESPQILYGATPQAYEADE
jgi:hypothetical protein